MGVTLLIFIYVREKREKWKAPQLTNFEIVQIERPNKKQNNCS